MPKIKDKLTLRLRLGRGSLCAALAVVFRSGRGIRRVLLRWRGDGIFVGLWGICPLCFGNTARRGCAVSFFGLYRLRAVYLTMDRRMSGDVWEKTRANPVQGLLGGLCAALPFVSWFLIIWKLAWKEST